MQKRRLQNLSALLILLLLPACDLLGEEDQVRFEKQVEFRFDFSTEGLVGDPVGVESTETVDIEDELFAEGYTREEIASARIQSVTIQRLQPVGTNLDVFDQIDFTLAWPGMAGTTNATSNDLPASSSASLEVTASGVTTIVKEPAFGARLTVEPTIEEDFVLEASVTLSIDVEGI